MPMPPPIFQNFEQNYRGHNPGTTSSGLILRRFNEVIVTIRLMAAILYLNNKEQRYSLWRPQQLGKNIVKVPKL